MKKITILLLSAFLLLGGCAGLGKFTPTAQTAVDYVCAGEDGKITAADMLAVLELGRAIYSGDPVNIEKAISVLSIVKKTGCFVVDQLQAAFVVVDSVNASKVMAKGPKFAAATTRLEYPALRKFVK